jgi:hypothetical protein
MKTRNKIKSTGSSSQVPEKGWLSSVFDWLIIWWPVVVLTLILIGAGITKYVWPQTTIYSLMIQMTKAISVLMLVIYVIYTRLLALETRKMADASMGLFYSEKGRVASELNETTCNYNNLCEYAKSISQEIHIKEKRIPLKEYEEIVKAENLPAVSLLIKNLSARSIEADKIEYSVRHTGSDNKYDTFIKIGKDGTIKPWEDKTYYLMVAPEGEVEIIVEAIYYLDNRGIVNKIEIAKSLRIERIRKPESTING